MNPFLRRAWAGMLAGVLAFAALNSLSYFVRTGGELQHRGGRIGFPWLVWEDGGYGGGTFYSFALLANVGVGLVASAAIGCLFALVVRSNRPFSWPQWHAARVKSQDDIDQPEWPASSRPRQFTLRSMMLLITSIAVLLAAGQTADANVKRRLLILTYWFGPTALAASYCLASWLAPHARGRTMLLILPVAPLATLILGVSAGLNDWTLIALGFFVYWTPQCVLLLAFFVVWALAQAKPRNDRH